MSINQPVVEALNSFLNCSIILLIGSVAVVVEFCFVDAVLIAGLHCHR